MNREYTETELRIEAMRLAVKSLEGTFQPFSLIQERANLILDWIVNGDSE
jgi:hypothetical protein